MRKKKVTKKRITWTFQPSPEVVAMANLVLGEKSKDRGARTRLVNDAFKSAHPDKWKEVLERKRDQIDREISKLRTGKAARHGSK